MGSYLQLRIELNTTVIPSGDAILAQVLLSNPLGSNLTAVVPASDNSTVSNWSWYDFICGGGSLQGVFGFAVFQGHYESKNLSSAGNPLTLAPPLLPPCVAYAPPLFMVFQPSSSNAIVYSRYPLATPLSERTILNATTQTCSETTSGSTRCGPSSGLFGYWNGTVSGPTGNYTTSSPDFHYFTPGGYTIVAEDAWGHQAFQYFEVTPAA
jgi:hypothetical protein